MDQAAHHRFGLAITILGVAILVPDTLIIRLVEAEGETSPWSITVWRGLFTFIGLMTLYRAAEGPGAFSRALSLGRWGLVATLFMSFQNIAFMVAITHTTIANALLVVATAPLFAAIFSWVFLGERAPLRTWLAIFAAIGGIAIIFSGSFGGAGNPIGDVAALGTAIGLGCSFTIMRHRKDVNMIPATATGNLLSCLIVLPLAAPFAFNSTAFALLLLLGLIVLPLSFSLITLGPRYIPAPEVSLILLLETVAAPFVVWLVVGELPSALAMIGGAVVVGALFLHTLAALRARRR